MNTRSSSWTQRSHRTMDSAFGPYCSRHIEDTKDSYPAGFMVALYVIAAITLAIIWVTK